MPNNAVQAGEEQAADGPETACRIARHATKAALATMDVQSGGPLATLVTVAFDHAGAPLMLLSDLALHSRNIAANGQVSLLFDGTGGHADPLEGPRVPYRGMAARPADPLDRDRFLARHADAAAYADFGDFAFYRVDVDEVHFVGGFGRIFTRPADGILVADDVARAFADGEASVVDHVNADHADAVQQYAEILLDEPAGEWRLTGCDADGFDLATPDRRTRLDFPERLTRPALTRHAFKALSEAARAQS